MSNVQTPALFDLKAMMDAEAAEPLGLIAEHVNPTFAKVLKVLGFDIHYTHGRGAHLFDEQGNAYLDGLGGFGTFACGRNHPVIRDALKQAMDLDLPNLPKFGPPVLSGLLAKKLIDLAPGELDTVFFCNSGAESVETAMKYARAATGRDRILYASKAYHGLTFGALSLNGSKDFRAGFGQLLDNCTEVAFNDLDALEEKLRHNNVAAFIVEPVQGKGVFVPDDHYLRAALELCHKYGALFIADEVQTGFGRTGRMFACEHWGIEPDIMCTAKALSGGYVPVGATLSKRWIHNKVFSSLDRVLVHSTTFGQNDMAMAAGLATLHVLQSERIVENAAAMGQRIMAGFRSMIDRYDMVKEVRGKGLMIAVEFGPPKGLTLKAGWTLLHKLDQGLFPQAILIPLLTDHRILAQVAGHHMDVVKFTPPLVMTEADADHLIDAMDKVVASCHKFPGPVWEVGKRLGQQALKR
ncbi:MAG: aminotransferase class III-fold pyridoxal phosphate-dependent enzyme [Planctomycetes bacterium]|nr:aminotransferase class III-fold pyridoxal phosphate-dependent enzyme [Planctomycetota bacterium]